MYFEKNNLQTQAKRIELKKGRRPFVDVHYDEFLENFHCHLFHIISGELLSTKSKS